MWQQWLAFAVGSGVLVGISWRAMGHPRSHGFYRFWAWELMLALLVLNAPVWFYDRFSWNQEASWVLLFLSLVVLFMGVYQLRRDGRPNAQQRTDEELYAFERTSQLVTDGIYSLIRHPLFCSLQLLNWGIFFKQPGVVTGLLAGGASVFLYLAAKRDEAECTAFFGEAYRDYMQRTKMFVPYVF